MTRTRYTFSGEARSRRPAMTGSPCERGIVALSRSMGIAARPKGSDA